MIIKRRSWPFILALALLGPMVLGAVALKLFAGAAPSTYKERQSAAMGTVESSPEASVERLVMPDGDAIALDRIAPERSTAIIVMKAPWCPVCKRQLQALSKRLHDVQMADAAVVGLTTADAATNRKLMDQLGLQFPILGDPSKALHKKFGLWKKGSCHAIPGVVFLDEDGSVANIHRGRYPGQPQERFVLETLRGMAR